MSKTKDRFKRAGEATQFKPGQSGNPGGKPKNARQWLSAAFAKALAEDFEAHGVGAISDAREADPMGYIRVIASLMPEQLDVTITENDVANMTDAELLDLIAESREALARGGAGADPTPDGSSDPSGVH